MSNQFGIVWIVIASIFVTFWFGLFFGYAMAMRHYFPFKFRKVKSPGQMIDSLWGNDRRVAWYVLDTRLDGINAAWQLSAYMLIPVALVYSSAWDYFVAGGPLIWFKGGLSILIFIGITAMMFLSILKNPFRNFQEQDIQNQDVQGDLTVTEKNPQQDLIFIEENPLSELHEFHERAKQDPVLYSKYAQEIQAIFGDLKKNIFEQQLIRLLRLKEELRRIYSYHFWLKLHKNPRKRKQCNPEYVRRWFGMMNLPYDASDDPPQKKQHYIPLYYRRRVRDFT